MLSVRDLVILPRLGRRHRELITRNSDILWLVQCLRKCPSILPGRVPEEQKGKSFLSWCQIYRILFGATRCNWSLSPRDLQSALFQCRPHLSPNHKYAFLEFHWELDDLNVMETQTKFNAWTAEEQLNDLELEMKFTYRRRNARYHGHDSYHPNDHRARFGVDIVNHQHFQSYRSSVDGECAIGYVLPNEVMMMPFQPYSLDDEGSMHEIDPFRSDAVVAKLQQCKILHEGEGDALLPQTIRCLVMWTAAIVHG